MIVRKPKLTEVQQPFHSPRTFSQTDKWPMSRSVSSGYHAVSSQHAEITAHACVFSMFFVSCSVVIKDTNQNSFCCTGHCLQAENQGRERGPASPNPGIGPRQLQFVGIPLRTLILFDLQQPIIAQ